MTANGLALVYLSVCLFAGCTRQPADLRTYDEEVLRDPASPAPYENRGWARATRGDLHGAIADFDEALRLNPADAAAYTLRGEVYLQQGEIDKAVHDLTDAIRFDDKDAVAYQNRGWALLYKGQVEGGLTDLDEAIRLDPTLPEVHRTRASAHYSLGHYAKAIDDLQTAVRIDPKDANSYGILAWILATCPNPSVRNGALAVKAAEVAYELDHTWHSLATLAAAYAEAGDFQRAKDCLSRAMKMAEGLTPSQRSLVQEQLVLYKQGKAYHEPAAK